MSGQIKGYKKANVPCPPNAPPPSKNLGLPLAIAQSSRPALDQGGHSRDQIRGVISPQTR